MAYKDVRQGEQYRNDYTRQAYDRMSILPSKAEGAEIRAAASAAGQSVSSYILQAVRERMQRERVNESAED